MTRATLALSLALALGGCTIQGPQVFVHVDAEQNVRDAVDTLDVRIWGRGPDEPYVDDPNVEERANNLGTDTAWPWVVAIRPFNHSAERFWRVEATGRGGDDGDVVARVASGFQSGTTQHIYVLLEDDCLGVACEDLGTSCRRGSCMQIGMGMPFDPEAGVPDAGPTDAGADCPDEVCNGDDDDCDGFIDEDIERSPEVCNGVDDNCNQQIDEGFEGVPELCDRVDNNCDGVTDEGFDLQNDVMHCGGCDSECAPYDNAVASCAGGDCVYTCEPLFRDCETVEDDGTPSCETPIDGNNCEQCGEACEALEFCDRTAATPVCTETCPSGTSQCNGNCVDSMSDPLNCGAGCVVCPGAPGAVPVCMAGVCGVACLSGRGDCTAAPGCETFLNTDAAHCGTCGESCDSRGEAQTTCMGGQCRWACNTGFDDCDSDLNAANGQASSGCETDVRADIDHCGGCFVDCPSPGQCSLPTCSASMCGVEPDHGAFCTPPSPCASGMCDGFSCVEQAGCSDAGDIFDSGFDSGTDAGPDTGPEAGPDSGTDAGPDTGPEAGPDAGECDAGCPNGYCCLLDCCTFPVGSLCMGAAGCGPDPSCGGGCGPGEACCGGQCCLTGDCEQTGGGGWQCADDPCSPNPCDGGLCCPRAGGMFDCCDGGTCGGGGCLGLGDAAVAAPPP